MFQTVRHWWTGGRGKVTARLFLFELFVVVVGVLIAQGLANWVQDRADARRADEARHSLDAEVARASANALNLKPQLKCLNLRLDWILQEARQGHHFTLTELARPDIERYPPTPLPADLVPLFRERVGAEVADRYDRAMRNALVLDQFFITVRDTWPELEMLDTSWGPPGGEDSAGVRRAALKLRLAMAKMSARADDIVTTARQLGIAPRTYVVSGRPSDPITDCREFLARAGIPVSKGA